MNTLPRGIRFAPSPTGIFHLGNLRTAWVSNELARRLQHPWIVRFEDIDKPRAIPGATEQQLEDMAALGLKPDVVLLQSERYERHLELFKNARNDGILYPCYCSRKEVVAAVAEMASAPHGDLPIYNGECRRNPRKQEKDSVAWRFRSADESGAQDFIAARTDIAGNHFAPAYHWACAIDDYDGDYYMLVRAWDLAPAIGPQRSVFNWLSSKERAKQYPAVFHTSLVVRDDGKRLEKRTKGATLSDLDALGYAPKKILELFAKSFLDPDQISEQKKEITLSELGFASYSL